MRSLTVVVDIPHSFLHSRKHIVVGSYHNLERKGRGGEGRGGEGRGGEGRGGEGRGGEGREGRGGEGRGGEGRGREEVVYRWRGKWKRKGKEKTN